MENLTFNHAPSGTIWANEYSTFQMQIVKQINETNKFI